MVLASVQEDCGQTRVGAVCQGASVKGAVCHRVHGGGGEQKGLREAQEGLRTGVQHVLHATQHAALRDDRRLAQEQHGEVWVRRALARMLRL